MEWQNLKDAAQNQQVDVSGNTIPTATYTTLAAQFFGYDEAKMAAMVAEGDLNNDQMVDESEHHMFRAYIERVGPWMCTLSYGQWNTLTDEQSRFAEHQACLAN